MKSQLGVPITKLIPKTCHAMVAVILVHLLSEESDVGFLLSPKLTQTSEFTIHQQSETRACRNTVQVELGVHKIGFPGSAKLSEVELWCYWLCSLSAHTPAWTRDSISALEPYRGQCCWWPPRKQSAYFSNSFLPLSY